MAILRQYGWILRIIIFLQRWGKALSDASRKICGRLHKEPHSFFKARRLVEGKSKGRIIKAYKVSDGRENEKNSRRPISLSCNVGPMAFFFSLFFSTPHSLFSFPHFFQPWRAWRFLSLTLLIESNRALLHWISFSTPSLWNPLHHARGEYREKIPQHGSKRKEENLKEVQENMRPRIN